MKTIEERALEYTDGLEYNKGLGAYKAYIAGVKDQQYIDKILIEQLIDKAWSIANSMYQAGKDNLIPLTKDEFRKAMEE